MGNNPGHAGPCRLGWALGASDVKCRRAYRRRRWHFHLEGRHIVIEGMGLSLPDVHVQGIAEHATCFTECDVFKVLPCCSLCQTLFFFLFLRFYLFIFRERGREGERRREKHQCVVVASCTPPTGDLAHNPGVCPDWELNWQHFGLQAGTQSTEPHQWGPF